VLEEGVVLWVGRRHRRRRKEQKKLMRRRRRRTRGIVVVVVTYSLAVGHFSCWLNNPNND
jgi:hypothetical protein